MKSRLKLAGMLLMICGLAACGDDSDDSVKVGKVVKGPVIGAHVFDKDNVDFATTDTTGTFTIANRQGPFRTTGGTYVALNADGTPGAAVLAPPMSAPEGFSQVTPLSTLIERAPLAEQAALTAKLATLGFTSATDLSVKTAANTDMLVLSESVGAVLQSASVNSVTGSAVTAMIAAVTSLPAGVSPALTAVTTAVTNAITASSALSSVAATLTNAATTAAQGSDNLDVGPLPTTGTTGGTTGGTGTGF